MGILRTKKGFDRALQYMSNPPPLMYCYIGDKKESKGTMLDDLFKKTIAVPSIYWLPLTDKEVIILPSRFYFLVPSP